MKTGGFDLQKPSITLLFAVCVMATISTRSFASSPEAGPPPVEELPPFRVLADMLTITFRADQHEALLDAEVTRVTPNSPAAQRDIEVHDQLVAINDIPVVLAQYDKMNALLGQDLKPGDVLKLSFIGRRGFLGQRHIKYDFVIMRRAAKPNQP